MKIDIGKRMDKPSKLRVYFDTELNAQEKALMQTYIYNLALYSKSFAAIDFTQSVPAEGH